jgi:AraC-like DNA-binding protein
MVTTHDTPGGLADGMGLLRQGCVVSDPCPDVACKEARLPRTVELSPSNVPSRCAADRTDTEVAGYRSASGGSGRENFETLRSYMAEQFVPVSLWTEDIDSFRAGMRSRSLGAVQLSDVWTHNALAASRSRRLITSTDPDYLMVALQLRGMSVMSQGNQQATLRPGDFVLCDTARPYQISGTASGHMQTVMFSREALRLASAQLERLTGRQISGRDGLGALVSQYLISLGQLPHTGVYASWHMSEATLDLLVGLFSERLESIGANAVGSGKVGLLLRIRAYITHRLGDPQLDVTSIAAAHYISSRSLQKLFEGQGVSCWIRSQRLEYCRRDLADPALAEQPVSSIAARWGLVDAARFSRLFKSTYGLSPREYRKKTVTKLGSDTMECAYSNCTIKHI